ncbi:MAG: succinate dehydrogenase iron-sulfur subunit [Chloroflexi bacterium]|nr:succinate dehydrogenase iron-sulfur subunit [Ardenticatenaceae bacterium]MBL1128371.1 succinate dehydrogenase iron-sulfur subunit [Chloroflexota bacterium]NOG34447.1 succinate dehydrogenase iron-sulfur subunit [Chloroflexota bacterium]GIK57665.1 MAG: succinate dehydrogenase iron-sulfur subunit [Chloroflexota bacterium]
MQVHIRIRRFNPETDNKPRWGEYTVNDVNPTDSVLDVLHRVKWEQDGTLTLRRSCAHGVCGSDAMRINGANMLACKTLVSRIAKPGSDQAKIQVEPILGLRVIKDLVVDMDPFFDHYRSVLPYFVNDNVPADGREFRQSPEDRARFDDTTKCILCAACTTSCPSFWANEKYVGPAAIVQAHRFIFDSRDQAAEERLKVVGDSFGVWRCRTNFNCTNACPREIEVTKAIAEVKGVLARGKI